MALQDTQAAGSSQWRTNHIHPVLYVETTRSEALLSQHRSKAYRRSSFRETAYTEAMWGGICALMKEAETHLRSAIRDGHLLFCWEGSKLPAAWREAYEGGAA